MDDGGRNETQPYGTREVHLSDGVLAVGTWGPEDGVPVVAVHGITASHLAWAAVARALPGHRLLAPDLRGRGRSNRLPAPSGMIRHADDLLAVLEDVGVERAVVAGHSMGGFVALAFADRHAERVDRLVLADGGLPLLLPEGMDVDTATQATLGPALARLNMTFHDRAAYRAFWKQHPALGPYWSAGVEAYVDYDLEPVPGPGGGAWRSRVRSQHVIDDSRDLHDVGAVEQRLDGLQRPVAFLRAPRGLFDEDAGLYPQATLDAWAARQPLITASTVPDVNHYTLLFAPHGAEAVAAAIRGSGPQA
jgi:pimeloyl-ACP methyl ester carboxylesterase